MLMFSHHFSVKHKIIHVIYNNNNKNNDDDKDDDNNNKWLQCRYIMFQQMSSHLSNATRTMSYPITTLPWMPTWSQYAFSICWNMKGWLQSLRSCMMVFIRALAPPFPCFPFSDPSVRRTPLLCMWLQHKQSDNITATPVFRQCKIWHFMEGRESKNAHITCNNLTYFTIIWGPTMTYTCAYVSHLPEHKITPHITWPTFTIFNFQENTYTEHV